MTNKDGEATAPNAKVPSRIMIISSNPSEYCMFDTVGKAVRKCDLLIADGIRFGVFVGEAISYGRLIAMQPPKYGPNPEVVSDDVFE